MIENKESGLGSVTGGFAYSAAVVAYLAINLIFSIVCVAAKINRETDSFTYVSYLIAPAAIAVSLPAVLKKHNVPLRRIMPFKTSPKYYVVAVLLAFGMLFSVSWLNVWFEKFLGLFGYKDESSYFPNLSGGMVVVALIVMAVIPAIFEETLFRGALLNNMECETGTLNAVFICGFCFSLFHASAVQTVYQFVCGCAFALLAVRSRSVLPCVLAHFLNNAAIIVLEACGFDTSGTIFDWAPLWVSILVTVLSAVAAVGCAVFLVLDKKPTFASAKGGVSRFFVAASAGIAVLAVVWIANLF